MSRRNKRSGWLWKVILVVLGIGIIGTLMNQSQESEDIAKADELWKNGKKSEAIAKYKEGYGAAGQRKEELLKRIVETELENGKEKEARQWIEKAWSEKLNPTFNDAAKKLAARMKAERVTFTLADEKLADTPIKTQVEQHLVASRLPSKSELEAELQQRYEVAKARRGFRHHNSPTNIYIYVYANRAQAEAGQGLWIGMLAKSFSDKEPKIQINEDRLIALREPPKEIFGLSELERKIVWRDLVAAEARAEREARQQIPDSQIKKQVELQHQLEKKYETELLQKHGLTKDQALKITVEAARKGWPMPKSSQAE